MLQSSWTCRACRLFTIRRHINNLSATRKRHISGNTRLFKISEEIRQAISERKPVVALETTIYTHGFPYPDNISLATHLESLIRSNGGIPATIGILDGVARVGLDNHELARLVSSAGTPRTMKISRRDFGFALGLKDKDGIPFNGGTTIAATMILAHMAGIRIFATGGLGGVHRGGETTMDVSADLTELGRTPVAVISSGCKAFLDLPKTLEVLETMGVAVATFSDGKDAGEAVDFPAFWTRESGVPSPKTLISEKQAAEVIHAHMEFGLQSGLHFANPIPEPHSLPKDVMEAAIYEAIKHASVAGAVGAAATPWILSKIREVTGDKSLVANRALIEANVVRGTNVAKELSKLELEIERDVNRTVESTSVPIPYAYPSTHTPNTKSLAQPTQQRTEDPRAPQLEPVPNVFVAGSLAIDLSCDFVDRTGRSAQHANQPSLGTSNPAQITQSLGGVGSNVARAAHLMGANVRLLSAVADDFSGRVAIQALSDTGLSTTGIFTLPSDSGHRTAQYVAVNDSHKDLMLAMADMSIFESTEPGINTINDAFESVWLPQLRRARPSHLIVDANWPAAYVARWLAAGKEIDAHVTFEPVSTIKGANVFRLPDPLDLATFPISSIHLITPNTLELAQMHSTARERGFLERADWWEVIDALGISHAGARSQLTLATSSELVDRGFPQQSIQLLPFFPSICTKLGREGVLLTQLIPAYDGRLTSGKYAPYILSRCANDTEDTLGVGGVYMRLFPAVEEVPAEEIVSVNGVGDTFAGTLVAGLACRKGARIEDLIDIAQRAAVLSLKSKESVSPGLGTLRILM